MRKLQALLARVAALALALWGATASAAAPPGQARGNGAGELTHHGIAARVPDAAKPGPYAAGYVHYTLFDPSRPGDRPGDSTFRDTGRPIAVSVWYPAEPEAARRAGPASYPLDPYYGALEHLSSLDFEALGIDAAFEGPRPAHGSWPVVLLSPGAVFPDLSHVSLGTRLASHGFVVAVPYHFGMQWWGWEPGVDHLAVLAWDRPRDLSFILDDLQRRNGAEGDLFHRRLSAHQVAAGGWSLGGYAGMALASGDDSVCDTTYGMWPGDPPAWTCASTPPDPRVRALLLLSAGSHLLHFQEMQRIDLPALALGETWETLVQTVGPAMASYQARQHLAMSGHPNYRVDVKRAIHFSFSDECEYALLMKAKAIPAAAGELFWSWDDILAFDCGPEVIPSADMRRILTSYAVAFLKTHLLHQPGYRHLLTPRWALAHEPLVELFTRERCEPPVPTPDWPPDWVYFQHQPLPGDRGGEPCPEEDPP